MFEHNWDTIAPTLHTLFVTSRPMPAVPISGDGSVEPVFTPFPVEVTPVANVNTPAPITHPSTPPGPVPPPPIGQTNPTPLHHSVRPVVSSHNVPPTRPPINGTRPPVNGTRPPFNAIRPPFNTTRPPFNANRPPTNAPRPPTNATRPPANILPTAGYPNQAPPQPQPLSYLGGDITFYIVQTQSDGSDSYSTLSMPSSATIAELKLHINSELFIPQYLQTLYVENTQVDLDESQTLAAAGISQESAVRVVRPVPAFRKPVVYFFPSSSSTSNSENGLLIRADVGLMPGWTFDCLYPTPQMTWKRAEGKTPGVALQEIDEYVSWSFFAQTNGNLKMADSQTEVSYLFWEAK